MEIPLLDRLIDPVVFFDPRDVPTDNLRHGVPAGFVEPLKLGNRDFSHVAIDRGPDHRLRRQEGYALQRKGQQQQKALDGYHWFSPL